MSVSEGHPGPVADSPAGKAGESILDLLKEAAEGAQRSEQAAKAKARAAQDALTRAERRIAELEQQLAAAEQRVIDAEHWIVRVCREVEGGWVGSTVRGAGAPSTSG